MIEQIKNRILQIRRAYGLEVSFLPGDELAIQLVTVRLEKSKVIKESERHSIATVADLAKLIPSGAAVAVTVNGKGVVHKKISAEDGTNKIFEKALPNANPVDFYVEIGYYELNRSVFIVRRTQLDSIVEQLLRGKYKVLALSLGVADLRYLMPFLNLDSGSGEIKTNHFMVQSDPQRRITDIAASAFPAGEVRPRIEYSIGNQYVFSTGLMAFASAMGLLTGSAYSGEGISNDRVAGERMEYRYSRYFRAASWSLLGGVVTLLLISFLLYNHYAGRNEEDAATQLQLESQQQKAKQLEDGLVSKEKFISRFGWDHSSRLSLYADRIAALAPEEAVLTSMKINPVNTAAFSDNGLISFQQDTIEVTGTCDDPAELNRFVNNLRNIRDFRDISVKSYMYKKEIQSGIFFMEIITI